MLSYVMDGRCYAFTLLLTITTVSCSHHPNQALSQAPEAANQSHDSANQSHVAVNKAQDSANKTLDLANESHDSGNQTLEAAKIPDLFEASHIRNRSRRNLEGVIQAIKPQQVVDKHNDYRRNEGSSNMKKMIWNDTLAELAANFTKQCTFTASRPVLYREPEQQQQPPPDFGEGGGWGGGPQSRESPVDLTIGLGWTLFADIEDKGLLFVIDHYMLERDDYDHERRSCSRDKVCYHYLQIVWPSTDQLGCAYAKCDVLRGFGSNAYLALCFYSPSIEVNSRLREHINFGPGCSTCLGQQWCDDGLCVQNCSQSAKTCACKSVCHHCGKVNRTACQCNCIDGYKGPDCTEACYDLEIVNTREAVYCRRRFYDGRSDDDNDRSGGRKVENKPIDRCTIDPFYQHACAATCQYCKVAKLGAPEQECTEDLIERASRSVWISPPLTLKLNLLIESVLLLSLHNYL